MRNVFGCTHTAAETRYHELKWVFGCQGAVATIYISDDEMLRNEYDVLCLILNNNLNIIFRPMALHGKIEFEIRIHKFNILAPPFSNHFQKSAPLIQTVPTYSEAPPRITYTPSPLSLPNETECRSGQCRFKVARHDVPVSHPMFDIVAWLRSRIHQTSCVSAQQQQVTKYSGYSAVTAHLCAN